MKALIEVSHYQIASVELLISCGWANNLNEILKFMRRGYGVPGIRCRKCRDSGRGNPLLLYHDVKDKTWCPVCNMEE